MMKLSAIARALLLGLWATLAAPLLVKALSERPTEATIGAMNLIYRFAELPWVYPAALVLGGLAAGAWIDWGLRRIDGSRAATRKKIGYALTVLADHIQDRQHRTYGNWPRNTADLSANIKSAYLDLHNLGIWTPNERFHKRGSDGAELTISFLREVGTLLNNGHFKAARELAAFVEAEVLKFESGGASAPSAISSSSKDAASRP